LTFFGLWNRCVAELIVRYRDAGEIGLYHCLDYHGALVPLYIEQRGLPPIPTAVTLHNAQYQGALLSTLTDNDWELLTKTLGLVAARETCELEGDFNMLHAVVQYVSRWQGGAGITAVSNKYAAHLERAEQLLRCACVHHPRPVLARDAVPARRRSWEIAPHATH
jgi:glycogen synthase